MEVVSTSEHGHACGRFLDLVQEEDWRTWGRWSCGMRCGGEGAALGMRGRGRGRRRIDISPLVAATLALGAAAGVTGGEVVIYLDGLRRWLVRPVAGRDGRAGARARDDRARHRSFAFSRRWTRSGRSSANRVLLAAADRAGGWRRVASS